MEPRITGKLRRDVQKKAQKSGYTYIYDRITMYDPETKGYKQVATRLIGKIPPGKSGLKDMIETRPKRVNWRDFNRRKAAKANWEYWLHAYEVQEGIAPEETPAADCQSDLPNDPASCTSADPSSIDGALTPISLSSESCQNATTAPGSDNTGSESENEGQGSAASAAAFVQDFYDAEKVRAVLEGQNVFARKTSYMVDALLDWIGRASGIDKAVVQAFPGDKGTAQKVLSMARFWTAKQGETINNIDEWSIFHRLPYRDGVSSDMCYAAMNVIGLDASVPYRFFLDRAKRCPDGALLLVDSTTIYSYSKNLTSVDYGHNKANNKLPVAKVFTLYCAQSREPISFFIERGSVPDVSNLVDAAKQYAQIRNKQLAKLIFDGGFFSESNLSFISNKHYNILMRSPIRCTWIKPEFKKICDKLRSEDNVCEFDSDVHCEMACFEHAFPRVRQRSRNGVAAGEKVYETRRVYLYFFLDENREREERHVFFEQLREAKAEVKITGNTNCLTKELRKYKKYLEVKRNIKTSKISVILNKKKIHEDISLCGCFALFSFKKIPNDEALREYRIREKTEESFKLDKVFNDANSTRSHNVVSLDGRLFCQFVALCYEEFLYQRLRDAKEEQSKKIEDGVSSGTLTGQALEAELGLLRWLNSTSVKKMFNQLDAYKDLELTVGTAKTKRKDSTLNRDAMFFKLLGIKP